MVSQNEVRTIVDTHSSDGEARNVSWACARDGSLIIVETSKGPLTQAVFGTSSRSHQVTVSPENLPALGWVLGSLTVCTSVEDVVPYARLFMAGEGLFLSDLMDIMDERHLPYVYASYTACGDLFFRPPQMGRVICDDKHKAPQAKDLRGSRLVGAGERT